LRCEVCGRKIYGKPFRTIIEGAKLTVCTECSKHGTIIWEESESKTTPQKPRAAMPLPLKTQRKEKPQKAVDTAVELVEGFDVKIRQAREKLGISHEELGKRLSEKVSVLRKIETGKMFPDNKLAAKLEHSLKIKLLVPASEEKVPQKNIPKPASRELTLGDLIKFDKKKAEEKQ
jgi:putative transcription factor